MLQLFIEAGHEYTKTNKLIIPDEFKEAIVNTLEANDEVKMWFNDNCEYGDEFKCSKKELEDAISNRSVKFKMKYNELLILNMIGNYDMERRTHKEDLKVL